MCHPLSSINSDDSLVISVVCDGGEAVERSEMSFAGSSIPVTVKTAVHDDESMGHHNIGIEGHTA